MPAGNVAVIKVNNQQKSVMDLNENTKFDVIINNTVTNTVVVEDGFAYVINASCPDKLCQKHKKINKTGESIVCLPNKVVVSIEGSKNTDEIDGVAK